MKKAILLFIFICFNLIVLSDEPINKNETEKRIYFDETTIKLFQAIPILSDGRVKPLNTYASFILLKINGKRVVSDSIFKDESGEVLPIRELNTNSIRYSKHSAPKKIQPMEWFLTVLFYPEQAMQQRIFLVDNSEVLESCGAKNIEARDRYSYAELEPLKQELFKKAGEIEQKDAKKLTLLEKQTLRLGLNMLEFLRIAKALDFARPMKETTEPGIDLRKPARHVIANILAIQKNILNTKDFESIPIEKQNKFKEELDNISMEALELFMQADWLTIFPPQDTKSKEWNSPYKLFVGNDSKSNGFDFQAILTAFEETCMAINDQKVTSETFQKLAKLLEAQINSQPAAAITTDKINTENFYYKADFIFKALLIYIAVFLSICISFFKPEAKLWHNLNTKLLYISTACLILAITLRCFILGRPPVATLYETILFVTAIICIACLYMENVYKNRIATFSASIVGASGLFLSYAYEKGDGTDTMGNLAAVLNSNFWLSTHVTTVTIGYSAGLLAAIIAHIYIAAKVFRLTSDQEFYKSLHKMMYGVLCFCTLFATVGTILGGIWANYSWGRFWGWDPKENGALAIVLWNLIILHGRIGGIFKEFGIAIMCVFGGMVVVASWWGVNQLGVGLHSYGFTDGIVNNLIIFAVLELSVIAVALFHHYIIDRLKTTR